MGPKASLFEDTLEGTHNEPAVKTQAPAALIDQIKPRLGGHTDARIDAIGLLGCVAAVQQHRLMPVIDNGGQSGHPRKALEHLSVDLRMALDIFAQWRARADKTEIAARLCCTNGLRGGLPLFPDGINLRPL